MNLSKRILNGCQVTPMDQNYPSFLQNLVKDLQAQLSPLKDRMTEPYLVSDTEKAYPEPQLLSMLLHRGIVVICKVDEQPIGYIAYTEITDDPKSAYYTAYALPEWRRSRAVYQFGKDSVDYAFKVLGLNKLKTCLAQGNYAAYRAAKRLGFHETGYSLVDGLFNGKLVDMISLELINPDLVSKIYGRQESTNTPESDAVLSDAVSATGRVVLPKSDSDTSDTNAVSGKHDGRRRRAKRVGAGTGADEQKPNTSSRGKKRLRADIYERILKAAN